MNQRLAGWVRQATGMGFTTGILLIALGIAELSASLLVAVSVLAIGVGGIALRQPLRAQVDHPVFAAYLASIPIAPILAGLVMLLFLGASPGELQTLGGVIGLLAILNHMLRPAYALVNYLVSRLAGALA